MSQTTMAPIEAPEFDAIVHSDPAPLLLVLCSGEVVSTNPAARHEFGIEPGATLDSLIANTHGALRGFLARASGSREATPAAFDIRMPEGGTRRFRCLGALVEPPYAGRPALVLLRLLPQETASKAFIALTETVERLNHEIHEHMQAKHALEMSVREKEVLLQELHHRVRNNLQLLLSLTGMAIREETDGLVTERIEALRNRIFAMAAVQNLLHEANSLSALDAGSLIERLCHQLQEGAAPRGVRIATEVQPIIVDPGAAVALGLIVNELVTNSIKHAFPEGRVGEVHVRLRREEGRATLLVSDNGAGLPEGGMGKGLGSRILQAMASNLDAEVAKFGKHGTTVVLRFRIPEV